MSCVVVIRKCKNLQDFGVAHQRFEYLDPIFQIVSAVDDGLVPRRGLLLNPFAVSKPTDTGQLGMSVCSWRYSDFVQLNVDHIF